MTRIRYTAKADLNTADDPFDVYDFGGEDGYFSSAGNLIDRSDAFAVTITFFANGLTTTLSRLWSIPNFIYVYADEGEIYVHLTDGGSKSFTALVPESGRQNELTLRWGGDGSYEVTLNGVTDTGTTATYTALTDIFRVGPGAAGYPLNGWIVDVIIEIYGVVAYFWGCKDGAGTDLVPWIGAETLSLNTTGSPLPPGWKSYSPEHYMGNLYTSIVSLRKYDRQRKPVMAVSTSLSGVQRSTVSRSDVIYSIETAPISGADMRNIREFLSSCVTGERFQFTMGGITSDFTWFVLVGQPVERRVAMHGDGGDDDYFAFSWKQRETFAP